MGRSGPDISGWSVQVPKAGLWFHGAMAIDVCHVIRNSDAILSIRSFCPWSSGVTWRDRPNGAIVLMRDHVDGAIVLMERSC